MEFKTMKTLYKGNYMIELEEMKTKDYDQQIFTSVWMKKAYGKMDITRSLINVYM